MLVILVVAMLGNYAFQLTSLIYNASMLSAAGDDNVVSVSSRGMALSFLGGAIGVAIMESVMSGRLIPGVSGRGYAMLPAALFFMVCCLPGIFTPTLWQKKTDQVTKPPGRLHQRMLELWRESSREYRAGWFLAGYFALNSAIMGLTLYLPLHIKDVTGFEGLEAAGGLRGRGADVGGWGPLVVAKMRPGRAMARRIILVGLTLLGLNALVFSLMTALPLVVLCAAPARALLRGPHANGKGRLCVDLPLGLPGTRLRPLRRRAEALTGRGGFAVSACRRGQRDRRNGNGDSRHGCARSHRRPPLCPMGARHRPGLRALRLDRNRGRAGDGAKRTLTLTE